MTEGKPPEGLADPSGRRPGESAEEWFRRTFGPMPAPTSDMDALEAGVRHERRKEALAALERTIPPACRWASFSAPELPARVPPSSIGVGQSSWREPRICVMGICRAGKTSLAVAMLRHWVAWSERAAAFLHAYRLGVARIQHPAGHGEPASRLKVVESPFDEV